MPLFEYECDSHGHRFEVIQKLSDAPITTCQTCGGPVHKLPSSPAIQFKGTGWYVTDYARKSGSGASGSPANGKSGKDGKSSPASGSTSSSGPAEKTSTGPSSKDS
jgi:putative FmdB family regulatory protein